MSTTAILPAALAISRPTNRTLSSARSLSNPEQLRMQTLTIFGHTSSFNSSSALVIRMGGGPRTFPGGVSKWQWKRMQAKKAKQLLKARLCRERQLYEMRKRAELKAAISELEKPWEVVDKAPTLFSVGADEQVKALADRFQRAGGFDMWSERDGPQVFRTASGLPSARFFPKGVVHSVRPYGILPKSLEEGGNGLEEGGEELRFDDWIARGAGGTRRGSMGQASFSHGGGRGDLEVRHTRRLMDGVKEEGDGMEGRRDRGEGVRRNAYERRGGNGSSSQMISRGRGSGGQRYGSSQFGSTSDEMSGGGGQQYASSRFGEMSGDGRQRYGSSRFGSNSDEMSVGGRQRYGSSRFGSNSDEMSGGGGEERRGKMVGRGRYAGGNGRTKAEKALLQPVNNLYLEEGSYRRYRSSGRFSLNSDEMTSSEEGRGKTAGRGRYAGDSRQMKAEKGSLRPTNDLYLGEGSYQREGSYQQYGSYGRFNSDSGEMTGSEEKRGKTAGRGRYAGGNRRMNARKVYLEEGPYQQYGSSRLSGSDSDKMTGSKEERGTTAGRGRYAGRGNGQMKAEKVSLRPTTDLYLEGGSYRVRVPKQSS